MEKTRKDRGLRIILGAAALAVLLVCVLLGSRQQSVKDLPGDLYEFGLILQEQEDGLYVMGVAEDSPARIMGISPGDQILKLNDTEVSDSDEFERVARSNVGGTLTVTVKRNDEQLTLTLQKNQ